MKYSVYVNNFISYSQYIMCNTYRLITDDFNRLTMLYVDDDRPSKVLSTDPVVINKFRRKVLKRITEYATKDLQ